MPSSDADDSNPSGHDWPYIEWRGSEQCPWSGELMEYGITDDGMTYAHPIDGGNDDTKRWCCLFSGKKVDSWAEFVEWCKATAPEHWRHLI